MEEKLFQGDGFYVAKDENGYFVAETIKQSAAYGDLRHRYTTRDGGGYKVVSRKALSEKEALSMLEEHEKSLPGIKRAIRLFQSCCPFLYEGEPHFVTAGGTVEWRPKGGIGNHQSCAHVGHLPVSSIPASKEEAEKIIVEVVSAYWNK